MNKLRFGSGMLALLGFMCTAHAQFPLVPLINNVVQPVQLEVDTTRIFLTDYFTHPEKIDSVTFARGITADENKEDHTLLLSVEAGIKPLSEMKIWSGGTAYSVVLKKTQKKPVPFQLRHPTKWARVAGDFNGWSNQLNPMEGDGEAWKTEIWLNPGTYAYQFVCYESWMRDPMCRDSVSNGSGGFNSVITVPAEKQRPRLEFLAATDSTIIIGCNFPRYPFSLAFYWQNFRLGKTFINMRLAGEANAKSGNEQTKIEVKIPAEAKRFGRSYMRVYAYDDRSVGNDLLVPLNDGKVITDALSLNRNDKEADILYFVLVDRFNDGDTTNNKPCRNPLVSYKANYWGGDLAGVSAKIKAGYFKKLGINSLWLSPIIQNPETAFQEYKEPREWFSGYHGYWPVSLTRVDPHFGNEQSLMELVNTAHNSNMNLLLDLVANHVHEDYFLIKEHPEWKTPLILPDGRKNLRLWDECRLTTWFDEFLPTLDFTKPEVIQLEVDSAIYWLKKFHIDGFRHDATKHIPTPFWRQLTLAIKRDIELPERRSIYQLGETYGSNDLVHSYIGSGMLDGQFDFNLYFDAREVFAFNVPVKKLAERLEQSLDYFGSHHVMGNISGNHDLPRFSSLAGGALKRTDNAEKMAWAANVGVGNPIGFKKMELLMAFNAAIPGVPVICYGDEIGMPGAADPDNRRFMQFEHLPDEAVALKDKVSQFMNIRRNHMSLLFGTTKVLKDDGQVLVIQRKYLSDDIVVVLNNSDTDFQSTTLLGARYQPLIGNSTLVPKYSAVFFQKQ